NAVAGLGGETLNHYGLTAGQVYRVGVRNYNSALGTGTYTICVKMLKRGGCDYGPGPYTLCQYFKATWAGATGTNYTYTFTGLTGPAAGNVYTRTQNSDICVLSSVVPTLPYGSTYNVLITNIYSINDAAGVAETISVPALAPCSMTISTEPTTALRTTDQCAAGPRFRGAIVASLPWVCGATNWRWEFTELNASGQPVGLPITLNRGAASNYINLGTILQLQYGKTYSVRTAPILPYTGTNYQWGASVCMSIVGTAGMVADGSQANQQVVRMETANEVNMSLYPNPTHGTDVNINLSGITSENVQIRVVDAMGRQVWSNRYSVSGVLNTNITFERPLANGLYMVEAIFNGEVQTQRMMVQK
ncbi:MAG: T9SS type A sorting domain-containing protein, partial [Sediminibacterium sp.]